MHNILSFCRTCRRSPTGPRASPEMPRWRRRSRPKLKCLRPVVSTDPVTPALNKYINSGRTTTIHNHIIWSNTVNIRVYIYLTILYICVHIYIYKYRCAWNKQQLNQKQKQNQKQKTLQTPSTNNSSQGFAQHLNIWTICWIISLLYFNNYKFYFLM